MKKSKTKINKKTKRSPIGLRLIFIRFYIVKPKLLFPLVPPLQS